METSNIFEALYDYYNRNEHKMPKMGLSNGIAIGNVLGSNVFNILMILGITGLITPMAITGITMVDLAVMVASILFIWLFSFTKYRIERWEGIVLIIIFAGYMWWLL